MGGGGKKNFRRYVIAVMVKVRGDERGNARSFTVISRKVVGKNVHATTPKGNMGYDRLLLLLSVSTRKHIFMAFRANSFKFL